MKTSSSYSCRDSAAVETIEEAPQESALRQDHQDSFRAPTVIHYSLEKAARVSLKIYTESGETVATLVNGPQETGIYAVPFNTSKEVLGLPGGVYICRFVSHAITSERAGPFVSTKKVILKK